MSGVSDKAPIASGESVSENQDKQVSYETYSKTVEELKNLRNKNREYEASQKKLTEEQLQKDAKWQQLAEQKGKEADDFATRLKEKEDLIERSIKSSAFKNGLGGELIDKKYLVHAKLDQIAINPETMAPDENSVKMVVSDFIKEHPHLVKFQKGTLPNINSIGNISHSVKSLDEMSRDEILEYAMKHGEHLK